jgi:hypothetical protein
VKQIQDDAKFKFELTFQNNKFKKEVVQNLDEIKKQVFVGPESLRAEKYKDLYYQEKVALSE